MVHYDNVTVPSYNTRVSIHTTSDEQGKITSLSLNMNDRLYRTYNPTLDWNIRVSFPTPKRTLPYTGMF